MLCWDYLDFIAMETYCYVPFGEKSGRTNICEQFELCSSFTVLKRGVVSYHDESLDHTRRTFSGVKIEGLSLYIYYAMKKYIQTKEHADQRQG